MTLVLAFSVQGIADALRINQKARILVILGRYIGTTSTLPTVIRYQSLLLLRLHVMTRTSDYYDEGVTIVI